MNYDSQGNVVQPSLITQIQRVLAFSTTTPLGANAVYTSPTIDSINYKTYSQYLSSDQAGTFFVQYSDDGMTNWYNQTAAAQTLAANAVSLTGGASLILRYFRYVYTNGATAQTIFKFSITLAPL